MNIIQLVYKKNGKRITSMRILFVIRGVGVYANPEGALKASKQSLRRISVVIIGRLFNGGFSKEREDTFMEVKSYSFLKRNQFVKDFGLEIKDKPIIAKVMVGRGR